MSYINKEQQPHTITIETPAEIAEGAGGEPAWVLFRTRAKNKYFQTFSKLQQNALEISTLIEEVKNQPENQALLGEVDRLHSENAILIDLTYDAYLYFIVDWNWLDYETGQPLHKPDSRAVIEEELTPQQIAWLRNQIDQLRRYRATEGNG
jgi:hypothetical protein